MADQSRGLGHKENGDGSAPATKGKNYLFAIAIDEYIFCSKLNNAVYDVQAFIDLMGKRFDFEEEHILFIKNKDATKRQIENEFFRLIRKVTPQDNLVVYFSGHGRYDEQFGGNWVPVEAGTSDDDWADYLSNDQIKSYLGKIKSKHTFLIADSCFSGSLFMDKSKEKIAGDRLDTVPSRWGLTSGKKEIVSDGNPGQHSPFAQALLDVYARADQPPSTTMVCAMVMEMVIANAQQTPMGSPLAIDGHKGGQMVFYFKENEEEVWQTLKDTPDGCLSYLERFPEGRYKGLAEELILFNQQSKAWDLAKAANTKAALYRFEREYPNSEVVRTGAVDRALAALDEEELWKEAKNSDTVSAYRKYLRRSGLKKYEQSANEGIHKILKQEELQEWQRVKQDNTTAAYQKYLWEFPSGEFVKEAQMALANLLARKIRIELRDENNQTLRMPFSFFVNNLKQDSHSYIYKMHGKESGLSVKVEKRGYKKVLKKFALEDMELAGDHLVIQLEKQKEASVRVVDAKDHGPISKAKIQVRRYGENRWNAAQLSNEKGEAKLKDIFVGDDIAVRVECEGYEPVELGIYAIENKIIPIEKKKIKTPGGSGGLSSGSSPSLVGYKLDYKKVAIAGSSVLGVVLLIFLSWFLMQQSKKTQDIEEVKKALTDSLETYQTKISTIFQGYGYQLDTAKAREQYSTDFNLIKTNFDLEQTTIKAKHDDFKNQIDDFSSKNITLDSLNLGNAIKDYYSRLIESHPVKSQKLANLTKVINENIKDEQLKKQQENDRQRYKQLATTMCGGQVAKARSYARLVIANSMGFDDVEKNKLIQKFELIDKMLNLEYQLRTSSDQDVKKNSLNKLISIRDKNSGSFSTEQRNWLYKNINRH